jgi:hypothetical protein
MARIFVVGCPRSGTTVVQNMLAQHPRVYSLPETHFFARARPRSRLKRLLSWPALHVRGVVSDLLSELGRVDLMPLGRIGVFERDYARHFVAVLDRLTQDAGRDVWVEKTPLHLRSIDEIARRVPGARFVHVVRDGAATVASLHLAKSSHGRQWARERRVAGGSLEACARRWNEDLAISVAHAGDSAHLILSYEHAVADPERTARALARFTGLDYDDAMLQGELASDRTIRDGEPWKSRNREALSPRGEEHVLDAEVRDALSRMLTPVALDEYCQCGCRAAAEPSGAPAGQTHRESPARRVLAGFPGFVALVALAACASRAFVPVAVADESASHGVVLEAGPAVPMAGRDLLGISPLLTFTDQWLGEKDAAALCALHPSVLRFPGGTHANYYDWTEGKYVNTERFSGRHPWSTAPVDEFFELARRCGARVAYVVNVYQDSPDKTRRLAEKIKSAGYSVAYWELGNELGSGTYRDAIPDVDAYLRMAKEHAAAIRSVFPTAEFAVPSDPVRRVTDAWNRRLSRQDDFDNIVVHRYHGPNKKQRAADPSGEASLSEDAYGRMLEHSREEGPDYRRVFPGKHLWITEWGLLHIGTDLENSMAHGIWMARTFVAMTRREEITLAVYWNFNSDAFGTTQRRGSELMETIPQYVYTLLGDAARDATTTRALRPSRTRSDDVEAQLYERGDGSRAVLAINAAAHPVTVSLSGTLEPPLKAWIVAADDFRSSNGYALANTARLREGGNGATPVVIREEPVPGADVRLPAYAVVLIERPAS